MELCDISGFGWEKGGGVIGRVSLCLCVCVCVFVCGGGGGGAIL